MARSQYQKDKSAEAKAESAKTRAAGGKLTRDGELRSSTTGTQNPIANQEGWRKKLMAGRIKFDDEQKNIYLEQLAIHGLKGRAAKAAGVSMQCTRDHIENDSDFAEAVREAAAEYRDKFVDHAMDLAYNGIAVKKYNKDGDLIEERQDYPIRLIELELKRIEPTYREKQTIQIDDKSGGGVLVAPAELTPVEWVAAQKAKNQLRLDKAHAEHNPQLPAPSGHPPALIVEGKVISDND